MELSVVIPAYNEGEGIKGVLEEINAKVSVPHEILVVVDDKDDSTLKYVMGRADYNGVRGPIKGVLNGGKGYAKAVESGAIMAEGKYIVFVVADGSDDIDKIDAMHGLIDGGEFDVVCGSRYMPGGGISGAEGAEVKSFFSKIVNRLAKYKGVPTSDSTNSFKMISRRVRDKVFLDDGIESGKTEVGLEVCIKAWRRGFKFVDCPVVWTEKRSAGGGEFGIFKRASGYLRWLLA